MANLFIWNWIKGPFLHSNDRWKCWDNKIAKIEYWVPLKGRNHYSRGCRHRCHRNSLEKSNVFWNTNVGDPPAKVECLVNDASRSKVTFNLHISISHGISTSNGIRLKNVKGASDALWFNWFLLFFVHKLCHTDSYVVDSISEYKSKFNAVCCQFDIVLRYHFDICIWERNSVWKSTAFSL